MKRLLILMLAVILAVTPLCAYAQSYRDWWPTQVDENDLHYNFRTIGKWPNDVMSIEDIIETVTFNPKVLSVAPYSKSTKVTVDATTAARVIIVKYTVDGKTWEVKNYRNTSYIGPVSCHRKWQSKWHSKDDHYSSWCARQFVQAGKTIDYKKVAHTKGQGAQLYFDDVLIDSVRRKVKCVKTLNIPARVQMMRVRYAYTALHGGDAYTRWETVKVR
jgi:hypothetical protein